MSAVNSYSTLNTHRSALAFLSSESLGEDPHILRFFKGVANEKPQKTRYQHTWDPNKVLTYLADWYPNEDLSLDQLTRKLSMLMALCTAQRVQTLASIDINNISARDNKVYISIPERMKTTTKNRPNPLLSFPEKFEERPSLCLASVLTEYINRTSSLRSNSKLFVAVKKPHRDVTTQTISRWIKTTLEKSGVDTEIFSGHITRHASTSAAARKGLNIETIKKTAGWTPASQVFSRFLPFACH